MVGRWFFMIIGTIFSIMPAFVYWLAGTLAANGDPDAPTGRRRSSRSRRSRAGSFFPLGQLLNVQVEIQGSLALFDRIFEYLEMDPEIVDAPDAVALDHATVRGGVRFRDVSFHVPDRGRAVEPAHDLATVEAPTGRRCSRPWRSAASRRDRRGVEPADGVDVEARGALDGDRARQPANRQPSFGLDGIDFDGGAGRAGRARRAVRARARRRRRTSSRGCTTSTQGAVEIDDIDVRKITLASLGEVIGFVTQETYLFHASVRDNLPLRAARRDRRRARGRRRAAAIHDRITELPDGYDTIVGERGYKLSGGEKQRIAIARVLLKDPRILILDEATSALDTVSERLIQAAFERLMEGRTTIAIAHRLSTILRADRILVYERGRIVERGTHAELIARGGLYARLYREQFLAEDRARPDLEPDHAGSDDARPTRSVELEHLGGMHFDAGPELRPRTGLRRPRVQPGRQPGRDRSWPRSAACTRDGRRLDRGSRSARRSMPYRVHVRGEPARRVPAGPAPRSRSSTRSSGATCPRPAIRRCDRAVGDQVLPGQRDGLGRCHGRPPPLPRSGPTATHAYEAEGERHRHRAVRPAGHPGRSAVADRLRCERRLVRGCDRPRVQIRVTRSGTHQRRK